MIIETWHIASYICFSFLYCAARMVVKFTLNKRHMYGMSDTEIVCIYLFTVIITPIVIVVDLFTILFKAIKNIPRLLEVLVEVLD